jgi:adenylate kinase
MGLSARRLVQEGKLVPDEMVRELAEGAIVTNGCNQFVLDGYPRTIQQAQWLEEFLEGCESPLSGVISLVVPDDVIVDRLSKRRVDPTTGENYHLDFKPPPPDLPRDRIIQRDDDQPEVIRQRLEEYRRDTRPVQEFYRERGLLTEIDGVGPFEEVHDRILATLAVLETTP